MNLRSELLTNAESLKSISESWYQLLTRSDGDSIFLTPDWILTWVEMEKPKIFTVAVFDSQNLVGLAPFYLSDITFFKLRKKKCIRLLADENASSEYQDILVDRAKEADVLEEIGQCLWRCRDQFDFMWFPYCSEQSGAARRLERISSAIGFSHRQRAFSYYVLKLPEKAEDFDRKLKAKQRNNIRRYEKKLKGQFSDLELVNDIQEVGIDRAYESLCDLHARRWQEKGEAGVFERNKNFRDFLRRVSRKFGDQGATKALSLRSSQKILAIRWGFIYKSKFYEIQTGFDPAFNGSGIVSIYFSIKFAIDARWQIYDFLAGAGGYKSRFSEEEPGIKLFSGKRSALSGFLVRVGFWPTGRFINL